MIGQYLTVALLVVLAAVALPVAWTVVKTFFSGAPNGSSTSMPFIKKDMWRLAGIFVVVVGLIIGGGMYACDRIGVAHNEANPAYCQKYRLTMIVEVDGKERSGSTINALYMRHLSKWNIDNPNGTAAGIFGDALFLDLSPYGNVVATLHGQCGYNGPGAPESWPYWASPLKDRYCHADKFKLPLKRTELHSWNMPILVTFRDVMNPKSVEVVDPERFENTFGPNVRLKGVYVETTDDLLQRSAIAEKLLFLKTDPWKRGLGFSPSIEGPKPQHGFGMDAFSFVDCGRNCSWIKNGMSP